jgi:molybdopterin synthase sulfur carrier subunit
MGVKVRIPTPLRKLTNEQELVATESNSFYEIIEELQSSFPGIKERLLDDQGNVRRFVNIYVNEEDIRFLEGFGRTCRPIGDDDIRLSNGGMCDDGDEISIIPAIAGG